MLLNPSALHCVVSIPELKYKPSNDVLLKGDLILYSSMLRLWEGDYVRKKGYQREISNWCSENIENFNDQKKITAINWLFESRVNRFIDYAESVIIAKNKSDYEKINELIFIDSFRALFKTPSISNALRYVELL